MQGQLSGLWAEDFWGTPGGLGWEVLESRVREGLGRVVLSERDWTGEERGRAEWPQRPEAVRREVAGPLHRAVGSAGGRAHRGSTRRKATPLGVWRSLASHGCSPPCSEGQ